MRFGVVAVIALGGCNAILDVHDFAPPSGDAPVTPSVWLDGYHARKSIVFAARPTGVPRFVAAIRGTDQDVVDGARSDGTDLVIADVDGVLLPTELVRYASGAYELWVQIDLGASPTTAYLYWSGPATTRSSPWATAAGVWHMGDGDKLLDSSPHAHEAAAVSLQHLPETADGIVGEARRFDGIDDSMVVPDPIDGSLDFGTSSFTYSLWVDPPAYVGPFDTPFSKGGSSSAIPGYDIELGTNTWNAATSDTAGNALLVSVGGGQLGVWSQIAVVVDRTTGMIQTYRDGVRAEAKVFTSGSMSGAENLKFGSDTYPYRGMLDEVRIYPAIIDEAAIAAEYQNATSPSTFFTIGPLESQP